MRLHDTSRADRDGDQAGGHRDDGDSDTGTDADSESGLTCPECDVPGVTDSERGETVCPNCGLVLDDGMIDPGPEWRSFHPEERAQKSRVGAPRTETMHDRGLSTVIGWRNRDSGGHTLNPRQRQKMQRLRKWNERFRTRDARERNLKQALGEIDRMASALGLSETVRETASVIYRRALEEDLLPGRSIEGMATASLYAAARQANTPRSLDEFAVVSRVDRRKFARAYRYLADELDLAIEPADPEQYLPRFVSDLDVSDATETRARELLRAGRDDGLYSGKSPVSLAAAAIYAGSLLADDAVTQASVADVTDVSEVTIRYRYRDLLDAAGALEEAI